MGNPSALTPEQVLRLSADLWRAGRRDEAEQICRQIVECWPDHPDALHLLGVMAHARGDLAGSLAFLERACAWEHAPAQFHSEHAEILRQARRFADGEAAARRALDLDPQNAAIWNTLGLILQESGKLEESRIALERALSLAPESPGTHNNLANTVALLGDLRSACHHYERAAALDPGLTEAYNNLARVLCELGDTASAAAAVSQVLQRDPEFAEAHLTLAIVEQRRNHFPEALRALDEFVSRRPNDPRGFCERSRIFLKLEKSEQAYESAVAGTFAAPISAEAQLALGEALQSLGRDDEAVAAYERARTLRPAKAGVALVHTAGLFIEIGRFEEARAALDLALDSQPDLTSAWALRAKLKAYEPCDPELREIEGVLAQTQGYHERTLLHFALGNAYLQVDEPVRAFAHLFEGNRMERATFEYDVDADVASLYEIIAASPAAIFGRSRPDPASERAIFVIGMPRSGTSLVEQILSAHHEIHGAGELRTFPAVVDYARTMRDSSRSFARFVADLEPADAAAIGSAYLERTATLAPEKNRIVDKLPGNFLHAGLIALSLPSAQIIHVRRDPADTCFSCYATLFANPQPFAYDLSDLGRFYKGYERLAAHWRSVLPPEQFIEVQYENVVEDIERQARRLVAFCGLEWDDACLGFHNTPRRVRTASAQQVRQRIYRSSVGRWKLYERYLGSLLDEVNDKKGAKL